MLDIHEEQKLPYHTLGTDVGTVLCQTGDCSGGQNIRPNVDLFDNIGNVSKESNRSTDEDVFVEESI